MKKIVLIFSIVLILVCITVFASCGGDEKETSAPCQHNNLEKIEIIAGKDANCQETGLTEGKKCLECGTVIVSQSPIDKIDCIESDWILDFAPTASADGKQHTECTMCGKTLKEETISNDVSVEFTPFEFVEYFSYLIKNYESGNTFLDEGTIQAINTLSVIYKIAGGSHTADEMYALVSTGVMEGAGLSAFQVNQMYGLYLWDKINNGNTEIVFETILDYMAIDIANDKDAGALMDEQTASDLLELSKGLDEFKEQMDAYVTKEEFRKFGYEMFDNQSWVQTACDLLFTFAPKTDGKAKIVDLLKLVDKASFIVPSEYIAMMDNYIFVYNTIKETCTYSEFVPILQQVVTALTNEERTISADENLVQQAYIMYFNSIDVIPDEKIVGVDFLEFVNQTIDTNSIIGNNVSAESKVILQDVILVSDYILSSEKYDYEEMNALVEELDTEIKSDIFSSASFTTDKIYLVYCLYFNESK